MTNIDYENRRLLDVVNEDDKVIGAKSRNEIHRLGLLHREVHVWMFDKDFNIFFQKRGLHRASAGLLDATVGGHVNKGEDYMDAAIREVKEEAGISIRSSDLVLLRKLREKKDFLGTVNNFIRAVYLYKIPVDFKKIKKEAGIPGGGFQKLSREFLLKPTKEDLKIFDQFIYADELPYVLKHLK